MGVPAAACPPIRCAGSCASGAMSRSSSSPRRRPRAAARLSSWRSWSRRRASVKPLAKQDARLAAAVVVGSLRLDLEAEPPVERDRGLVERRGHAADSRAARSSHSREEPLVELGAEPAAAPVRPDADEVHVGLVRIRLRQETADEPDELAVLLGDEAGVAEVLEEEPRQHRAHRAAAPPGVEVWRDARVVGGLGMSNRDHARRLFHIRRSPDTERAPAASTVACVLARAVTYALIGIEPPRVQVE